MIQSLSGTNTLILTIDVQEKLIKAIKRKDTIVWNIRRMLDAGKLLGIKHLVTEQNPSKLGRTIPKLQDRVNNKVVEKMNFSCYDCILIKSFLKEHSIEELVICGLETHICIQQSALDFLKAGFKVFIPIDAVGSRRDLDHETSIRRLEMSGAIVTTTESAIFELCKTSDRKEFKQISNLIKEEQ